MAVSLRTTMASSSEQPSTSSAAVTTGESSSGSEDDTGPPSLLDRLKAPMRSELVRKRCYNLSIIEVFLSIILHYIC